jgi:hypothetical protein
VTRSPAEADDLVGELPLKAVRSLDADHAMPAAFAARAHATNAQLAVGVCGRVPACSAVAQMDANDRLLVTDVSGDVTAWRGLDREVARWILLNSPAESRP